MNCGISLLHYCQKPAMELLLNPPFNLSPVRGSCMLQPTLKMVLASILLQMDFGVAHSKEPFLMSGYSTLLLSQTVTPLSSQLTVITRTSRKDTMRRGSEKWNIHPSYLLYSPLQVVWDQLQALFTSDWLQCWRTNGSSHIAQQWAGYDVDSPSVSSVLL